MKIDIKNIRDYKIAKDTINIDEKIGKRSIASFTVIDENSLHHFNQGLPVEISNYSQEIPIYNGYFMPYRTKARLNYVKGKSQLKFSETDEEILSWEVSETLKNELIQDENGEWRIQENVGRIVFDGSEIYALDQILDNTLRFGMPFVGNISNQGRCNIFEYGQKNYNFEQIFYYSSVEYGSKFVIVINKSRLNGYSDELTNIEKINLFRQWLQDRYNEGNPLTVWYELAVKNPIEINLWEWENQGKNYWLDFEEKRTNTYWFLIDTYDLDLTKFIIPSLSQVSLFDDVEGYERVNSGQAYLFINVSTIDNLMAQYSTDEVGALKIYLEQENIYGIFELATPRLAEVKGLKHSKPIVQGIQFDKDVRSVNNAYDEFKDGYIFRKTKIISLADESKKDVSVTPHLETAYKYTFHDLLTRNKLKPNALISHFPYADDFENIDRCWSVVDNKFSLSIEKDIIDDILENAQVVREWKLQEYVSVKIYEYQWKLQERVEDMEQFIILEGNCPIGYEETNNPDGSKTCTRYFYNWKDVSPLQTQWSINQPNAGSGYRWVKTGQSKLVSEEFIWQDVIPNIVVWSINEPTADTNYRYVETGNTRLSVDEIDALFSYIRDNNVEAVFEIIDVTVENVKPLIFDIEKDEIISVENSLDTEMRMLIDYRLYYRGFIDSADERYVTQYLENGVLKKVRIHEVVCKDNVYLADKRLIRKSYVNMYCGDIVKDIIKSYLGIEGVKEGTIQQGEFMEEVVFKSIKISKALSRLAEASDFIWDIDNERKLHFMERETNINEIPITEADCKSINVSVGNMDYRNKQYIEGGKALTDLITETFKGDGENKNFTLSFPCGEKPEIYVAQVKVDDEDIGIKGVDEEKKWYWEKGSNVISQATDETAIPFDTTLMVMYRGLFEVIVSTLDTIEIEKRAELEDNSGIIEAIDEEIDNNSITTSFRSATAKLRKYAVDGKVIKVLTRRNDLHVGQMIRAIIPKHDIDQDVLISQVRIYTQDNVVWHEVELLIGPEVADFYDMFNEAVTKKTRSIYENIQEQEALVQAFEVTKTWGIEDTPNIFRELYPSNTLYPSPSLYPTFEKIQRVIYMEVIQDDETVARVKHIRQNEVNDVLTSIFYLDNATANGIITKLKFFGGYLATEEVGSGVLIDEVTLIDEIHKTIKDVIQIYRIDIKGY